MKSRSQIPTFFLVLIIVALFACSKTNSVNSKYNIASSKYEQLTGKYLQHIANFEWEESYTLLSDQVIFKLPDGDQDTRTVFSGIDEVKAFWSSYQKKSGNDQATFTDFVHLPVHINQEIENIGMTGVFNICYFTAKLHYGSETASVRMHWAFHFDANQKIDGIYTYYDRTPIIEAARKNFLATSHESNPEDMVIQTIKIRSNMTEDELIKTARKRAEKFKMIPGLLQKYYIRSSQPGEYGGVYVWDSKKSLQEFRQSELASGISQAYQIVEAPQIEISDVIFQLRD